MTLFDKKSISNLFVLASSIRLGNIVSLKIMLRDNKKDNWVYITFFTGLTYIKKNTTKQIFLEIPIQAVEIFCFYDLPKVQDWLKLLSSIVITIFTTIHIVATQASLISHLYFLVCTKYRTCVILVQNFCKNMYLSSIGKIWNMYGI